MGQRLVGDLNPIGSRPCRAHTTTSTRTGNSAALHCQPVMRSIMVASGEAKGRAMSQKALFERLGAPLANTRWSWGAVRMSDGAIFLRVWQDETMNRGNREFVRVAANEYFQKNAPKNLGYRERLNHLALVRNGARSYMIICVAIDVDATPRAVKSFNSDELYVGGQLIDVDGDFWLEIVGRVPVQDVRNPYANAHQSRHR